MNIRKKAFRLPAVLISIITVLSLLLVCNPISVLAAATITSLSPAGGPPGTSVTLNGTGFGPSESLTIAFDGGVVTSAVATAAGDLTCTFTVPAASAGPHNVIAYGAVTTTPAAASFTVTRVVTWSKTSGAPGTSVTLTGAGFGSSETINIYFTGITAAVATVTSSSTGAWSKSIKIPSLSSGATAVTLVGAITGSSVASFTITPAISLDKISGSPGTKVKVTGVGFGNAESGIAITFDNDVVASGITANAKGEWSDDFSVPSGASGSHAVGAYGSDSEKDDVPPASFTIGAGITLSKNSGAPGISVTVTGSGFGVRESGICITFDGVTVASGISANSNGAWSGNFTVPAVPAGAHYVGAFGNENNAEDISSLTFTIGAVITLNKTSGAPGNAITVTGAGFGVNETGITITFDGEEVASNIAANATGGWSSNFTVPAAASGSHNIGAYGATSSAGAVTGANLTVTAAVSLSTTTGAPGSTVTISGAGFGADETGINITLDGQQSLATGIKADATGSWTANVTIPALAFGAHTINAGGSLTQAGTTSLAGINVTPGISLSPATGNIGSTVIINGSGFTANSSIRITYDSVEIPMLNAVSDATGSLSQKITIPASLAGTHTIAVSDAQGNNVKTNFTIANTPPAAPAPTSPNDKKAIGLTGNAMPTFKWSPVSDPNGVTYRLQIDTNPEFAYPIIDKTGIQANYYTLYSSEALPRGTYYWRVKAINNAAVESPWSAARTVKSGVMAVWLLILIIVAGVAAIGVGIYFGVIRVLQRKREAITVSEVELGEQWPGLEAEETTRERRGAPRLALPEVTRSSKTVATEDQARLKIIVEFAQSIPLVGPEYNAKWVENLVENQTQTQLSAPLYEQMLGSDYQLRYEPTWMRHPIYKDLSAVLHKHPILHKLENYVTDMESCAAESLSLIQQIYRESKAEIPNDFLLRGGWNFLTAVYTDAINWYAGKSLHDPAERDYRLETANGGKEGAQRWLSGESTMSFAGHLILAKDEKEAQELRVIHQQLRRTWRNSEKARQVSATITQLQIKRNELLNAFAQFGITK